MRRIEIALRREGYAVRNLGYPSTRHDLAAIADRIAPAVADFAAGLDGPVHFVTHSMGGLVTRILLSRHRPGNLGRVVMLAPPNHGSEIADLLHRNPLFRRSLGPAAVQLVTRRDGALASLLGQPDFELGIIAGDRALDPVASLLLPRPNDGRVSVASTRDIRAADHVVLPVSHTSILWNRSAIRHTLTFLGSGRFES